MSSVTDPLTISINNNETSSHLKKEQRFHVTALSRGSLEEKSTKQNESKTVTKAGQIQLKPNVGSLPTLTGSNIATPYSSITPNPYSIPSPSKVSSRLGNPPAANRTNMVKSTVGFDRSRNVRAQVERAIRDHKIFTCVGVYPAVRKALQKRGWVEKNPSLGVARSTNLGTSVKDLDARNFDDESDQAWMNRVLRDYPPDFIWVIRRDNIDWRSLHKDQIINRYPKAFFTTKVGIASCLQSIHWFSESGISDTFFPRCYRLCIDEEKAAFIDDYRLSACMGLLKWVVGAYEKDGEMGVMDPASRVVSLAVDFAVRQVNNYVRMRRHEDIDWLMPPAFMGQHWDVFLNQYYNVVFLKGKLAPNDSQDTGKMKYDASKRALQRLVPFWPQLNIDGINNVWICKPGARSRGKGIVIMNQLDKILELLAQNNYRESNWVVQKYIERPMLIYKTKFDIRQWFIISDWSPLTVWFYKESYVRFCTKPFCLDDFHESIHLCNNAIQCRYQNADTRDSALPDENMWDCYTFQAYLKTLGKMDLWDSLIYPGMKQGILGVLLASQETVDIRKNCFELYGADFMLSDDLRPWLIEINSCPCMAPSTSVTARMCAQCLDDTVKVIIDKKEDKSADTGMFELIYKQTQSSIPLQPFNGVELIIQGKKLTRDVDWPSIMTKYNSKRLNGGSTSSRMLRATHQPSPSTNGLTFMDLVQRLRLKDAQTTSTLDTASSSPLATALSPKSRNQNDVQALNVPLKGSNSMKRSNQAEIISIRKFQGQEGMNNNVAHNLSNVLTVQQSNNINIESNALDNLNTSVSLKQSPASLIAAQIRSSMSNWKYSNKNQKRVRMIGAGQDKNNFNPAIPTTNDTTKLSVLLKNSTTNQPTMADLVRLSQEATLGTQLRSKTDPVSVSSSNVPDSLDEIDENRLGRFQQQPASKNKSKTSTTKNLLQGQQSIQAAPVSTGKIRPNARTNSNLNSNLPSSRVTPKQISQPAPLASSLSAKERTKEQESTSGITKYGKCSTSFYDIHKINTCHTSFDFDTNSTNTNDEKHGDPCSIKQVDDGIENNFLVKDSHFFDQTENDHEHGSQSSRDFNATYHVHTQSLAAQFSVDLNSNSNYDDNKSVDIFICLDDDNNINSSPTSGPESHYVELKSKRDIHCNNETNIGISITQSQIYSSPKSSKMKSEGSPSPNHFINLSHHRLLQQHPHPCYRVALDHPSSQSTLISSKKYLTTLPLKTVNINLM